MKNTVRKTLLRINQALFAPLKSKKELISERSAKLDPNNKDIQKKPLIISETDRAVHDDGFEHRSSEGRVDPAS